jgi:5'-AMP-activated protein kinase catalytic alpha subunit
MLPHHFFKTSCSDLGSYCWFFFARFYLVVVANLSFFMMLYLGKQEHLLIEKNETKPIVMNAFELITLSNGLNLLSQFDTPEV